MLKKSILTLFLGLLAIAMHAQRPAGTYYIGATAGLNLRATASPNGEKLGTAQYAEQVELLTPAADQSMTVDGLKGGMAQVKFGGKVGYMFDGYLVRYILPIKGEQVEDYVGRLWSSEADVLHEEHRKDYGGYASMEYAVHFQEMTWSEAFLIAKSLFGIPAPLQFLGDSGTGRKESKNPNASEGAWTDGLETVYDAGGKIEHIAYSHRGEGGGTVIVIELSKESGYRFKLSETDIAD